jgi:hypothetical protein
MLHKNAKKLTFSKWTTTKNGWFYLLGVATFKKQIEP